MFCAKRIKRTGKGIMGECMFQSTRKNCFMTRFIPLSFIFRKFGELLSAEQKHFLEENWLSFDAIEFGKSIVLYEVKTKNFENKSYRFCITENTVAILEKAKKLGFDTKIALVFLQDNWMFSVQFTDFNKREFWIHTNNAYDKKKYSKSGP